MKQAVKSLVAKWTSKIPSVFLITLLLVVVFADSGPASRPARAEDELRIELTVNGFVPGEAQHAPGTFAIAVENSTLPGAYVLRLKSEDGTVLKEVEVQKGSAAWTVSLQPGQYTLTEASHAQWLCRITVQ